MNKEFVPYTESLELKEIGFDEPCLAINNGDKLFYGAFKSTHAYYKEYAVILYQQAFMFFRKKYGLYHIIHCPAKNVANFTITGFNIPSVYSNVELKSYEEAELACLRKLIEIVKAK